MAFDHSPVGADVVGIDSPGGPQDHPGTSAPVVIALNGISKHSPASAPWPI